MPDKAGQARDRILAHLECKEQTIPDLPHLPLPTRAPPGSVNLAKRVAQSQGPAPFFPF